MSTIYAAYLSNPEQHLNAAASRPGFGPTPDAAVAAAQYWHNQEPWVVVRPFSRWPRWVEEEYYWQERLEETVCCLCGAQSPTKIRRVEAMFWRCPVCETAAPSTPWPSW